MPAPSRRRRSFGSMLTREWLHTGAAAKDCAASTRGAEYWRRTGVFRAGQGCGGIYTIASIISARHRHQVQGVADPYRACWRAAKENCHLVEDGKIHRRVVGVELAEVGVAVTRGRSRAGAARGRLLGPCQLKRARRARPLRDRLSWEFVGDRPPAAYGSVRGSAATLWTFCADDLMTKQST